MLGLDEAVASCRTGDVWIFRGTSVADRAIQAATNSPVNHVGMAVVLDDLPPLMWHAELGRALVDVWSGDRHRGVQLHDLRAAVQRWRVDYGQQAWLRQLSPEVGRREEDALLRTIARLDGVSFPSTGRLAGRWLAGRGRRVTSRQAQSKTLRPEAAYCAEVVATTYEDMGLLERDTRTNWYDPGTFWSGDALTLRPGWTLGGEIAVGSSTGLVSRHREARGHERRSLGHGPPPPGPG